MGPRTSYVPGTFSWVDLATSDPDAAMAFYGGLFGWTAEPVGDGGYRVLHLGDDAVGGLFTQAAGDPAWLSYVSVVDVDATTARAVENGATVVEEPADVFTAGRSAVLTDPQGATFALWQPGLRIGADRVNDPGCLTNNELATTDLAAAGEFYDAVFGWRIEQIDTGPDGPEMAAAFNGDNLNGNLSVDPSGAPPHWRPYFTVDSVHAALVRVDELGGTTVVGPVPIPAGQFALVTDPQGALFGLFEGDVDP